ncbi:Bifunctional purine biosynthetic protein ade1 [Actinomortierella ambigua]|nr:Bifunctional purine biosynthetic protein ade1 [Actinomortierella ambigua]
MAAIVSTNCPDLELIGRGKVRDLYRVDSESLLFVATDRMSAFDVIMNNGIPSKGKLLTKISVFWFTFLKDVMPNHLITADFEKMPEKVKQYRDQLEGRCMLVKSLKVLPIESIVRGYITGSAWSEYKKKGSVCDIPLPTGMQESQAFEKPLWTPSTKAEIGDHDENIHPSKVPGIIGAKLAAQMEKIFDKQYLRNYLLSIGFDKSTGITLPDHVVENTFAKYLEAYKLLTGEDAQL